MISDSELTQKKEDIKKDITDNKIMLYMKGNKDMPMCGFSNQVVHILNQSGVEFEAKNVLEDEVLRQAIKDFSDWPTIPQLYVNGEFIGGCDIVTELYQSGELKEALA